MANRKTQKKRERQQPKKSGVIQNGSKYPSNYEHIYNFVGGRPPAIRSSKDSGGDSGNE